MYIKTTHEEPELLYDGEVMGDAYAPPGIEFNDNGVAQVKREVGEVLIAKYDAIDEKGGDGE